MFMFVIIGVLVAIAIIVAINEAVKISKQNKKKQDAERAIKLLDDKDEFKKFLAYDNSSKPPSHSHQPPRPAHPH
ncbi:MAG: hypothetical protein K2I46_06945, partial [Clostridia bacterium]|nr:hypothetical protein [Clostridia bacterium]